MQSLRLNRFYRDINNILGCLQFDKVKHPLFSCELPYKNNKRFVSCIPEGVYRCVPKTSINFGYCYEVLEVPDRTGILIHIGNTYKDTSGCIVVGTQIGDLSGEEAVLNSRVAMQILKQNIKGAFELHIKNMF